MRQIITGASASLVLLAGFVFGGCAGGSGTSLSNLEKSEATTASAQSSTALGSLALEASLNQIDPTYAPLTGPPTVTPGVGNTATSGTVNLDFGSGTVVNNATVSGQIDAAYTVSANAATVTVTYTNVSVDTAAAGVVVLSGSLTITVADVTLAPSATGTITGTLTAASTDDVTTITPDLTYSVSGTAPTSIVVDGTMGLQSTAYGDWDGTFTGVTGSISPLTREITAGSINLASTSIPGLGADFVFTGANTGTVTIAPTGISTAFTL